MRPPDPPTGQRVGRSDSFDAETAAGSMFGGMATSVPESAYRLAEMIRQVKIARASAGKGRTSEIMTL